MSARVAARGHDPRETVVLLHSSASSARQYAQLLASSARFAPQLVQRSARGECGARN